MFSKDIRKTQPLMEKTFPYLQVYQVNSLTPSVIADENKEYIISLLIIADKEFIKKIRKPKSDLEGVCFNIIVESNDNEQENIVKIDIQFNNIDGQPRFKTEIPESDRMITPLKEAIQKTDEVMLWIANSKKIVECVYGIPLDDDERENILAQLNK